jgi:hypothetical protein
MAAKQKTGTAVAPQQQSRAMVPNIEVADEAMLAEMQGVEGAGVSTNPADRGVPFLFIASKNSKPLNPKKPEYLSHLVVGNSYNTVTGEAFDTENVPLPFIPCFFRSVYNEWTPQDQGGGFHGFHPMDTPLLNGATPKKAVDGSDRRDIFELDNGHELVLTHEYWGVLPDSWSQIVVPMSSSNLGASKKMQGLIGAQKVQTSKGIVTKPAFFSIFGLRTAYSENEAGDWYKFVPSIIGPNEDANLDELPE